MTISKAKASSNDMERYQVLIKDAQWLLENHRVSENAVINDMAALIKIRCNRFAESVKADVGRLWLEKECEALRVMMIKYIEKTGNDVSKFDFDIYNPFQVYVMPF